LLGLLAVMLLPVAESVLAGGDLHLVGPRTLFLVATLAVVFLNYLPTRLGLAAALLAAGCALALATLSGSDWLGGQRPKWLFASHCLLAAAPWAAYQWLQRKPPARS